MPIPPTTAFTSVADLGKQLRAGAFTSVDLTEFFLARLKKFGPQFNAVVRLTPERALQEARRADEELAAGKDRGPLHGIPYGVKDLLATKGTPTSWGAAPFKDQLIDADATVVTRLTDAGAVLCAKLSMVELAGGFGYRQAHASFTGPGLNPWNRGHWSGGSSSGPGAAVGAGLVPFAIGSETWGSIMSPSANCGITGLRPTYGRVSRHGAMALAWTMDKLGPMGRTAQDCGLVLQPIAGPDESDPTAADRDLEPFSNVKLPAKLKLATLKDGAKNVQPGVKRNFQRSLEELARFATFEEIELPDLPYGTVAGTLISCEMAAAFDEFISSGKSWELTAEEDRDGGYAAMMIPAKDYVNAMRIRVKIQQALDAILARYDAIVSPTRVTVAKHADRLFRESYPGHRGSSLSGGANAAGVPALCVPNGLGEDDLPTSLEFTGRAFSESRLVAIAHKYQSQTKWHLKHPEIK
jgi:aspartyl-tRNA(Asn)/glutamyl-tRNA(Gln) amidotransferase subunit A